MGRQTLHKLLLLATGATAVTALSTALAFACIAQTPPIRLDASEGPPQTRVSATGKGFSPSGGPVNVYWNSTTIAPVATVQPDVGGQVTFTITVPRTAKPGYYTVIAEQLDPTNGEMGRAVFEVTKRAPAAKTRQRTPPEPRAVERETGPRLGRGDAEKRSGEHDGESAPAVRDAPAPPTTAPVVKEQPARAAVNGSRARAPASPTIENRSPRPGLESSHSEAQRVPSERGALSDLWGGFGSSNTSTLESASSPLAAGGLAAGSRDAAFAAGLGMIALGLVALLGGLLVTVARRRRAPVRRTDSKRP